MSNNIQTRISMVCHTAIRISPPYALGSCNTILLGLPVILERINLGVYLDACHGIPCIFGLYSWTICCSSWNQPSRIGISPHLLATVDLSLPHIFPLLSLIELSLARDSLLSPSTFELWRGGHWNLFKLLYPSGCYLTSSWLSSTFLVKVAFPHPLE